MDEDIFKGDRKIDSTPREESFGGALKHIGKGLKVLLFKKFYANIIVVLLIIAASVVLTYYVKPGQMITGHAVVECNLTCPECEECVQECPELNCSECEEKTLTEYVYRYRCPNGAIVENSEDCLGDIPETDPEYTSTANGVSISLDDVYYEDDNGTLRIREIEYTIINKGSSAIKPKVGLKIYDKYTYEVKELGYLRTFRLDDILDVNEWVKRTEKVNLIVDEDKETVRLELFDMSSDPDEFITAIYRKFDFS